MKNRMKLQTKLIILFALPIISITIAAIIVLYVKLENQGEASLENKSSAILSRMEAARKYIAQQGMLDETIQKILKESPDGNLTDPQKRKVMNQVPVAGAWTIGMENAEAEHYIFRIATNNPRNSKHQATPLEEQFIQKMQSDKLEKLTYIDKATNSMWVMKPIYLDETQGCLKCHGNPENSPYKNGKDILGYKMENWKDKDSRGMFMIISDMKPVQEEVSSAVMSVTIAGVILLIIGLLLSIFFTSKIVNVIKQIIGVSGKVAQGNLQLKIDIETNDELEELGENINLMILSLNNVLLKVKESSTELAMATGEISHTANQISDGAQNQATQFEELSMSLQSTYNSASQASDFTQGSAKNADIAGISMQKSMEAMTKIDQSSRRISETLKIITEIAFQTNLLALNAAVEAARAGEHGRGFAVVASEVRKLAERSSFAAKEITEIINVSLDQVKEGVQVTQDAGVKIKEIIIAVRKTADALHDISLATREQNIAMERNTSITTGNAASAEELAASSETLADRANQLLELVEMFSLRTK